MTTLGLELPDLPGTARWSVSVRDADTDEVILTHDDNQVLATASVGKLFLLVETARQLLAGETRPGERVQRLAADLLSYPSLSDTLEQAEYSIRDWAQWTAMVSDNSATNVLVRTIGLDAVQTTTQQLGFSDSALLDRVRSERTPDLPWTLSVGSAAELATLMARLHRGDIVSEDVSSTVLAWIGSNVDTTLVADAFRLDPLEHNSSDRGYWVANKTGTTSTVRADVGVVRSEARALSWAVIANWAPDIDPRDDIIDAMRAIGRGLRQLVPVK